MLYSSIATAVSGLPPGRTSTYVVAFSNSPAKEKAQADYVMKGTSATDSINITADVTAINNMIGLFGSSGGKIQFLTGTGWINSPILFTDNIFFCGLGYATSNLVLANGANCNMFERTGATNSNNFFNWWHALYLGGNSANNTSGRAIYSADYSHDFQIHGCFVNDFKTDNIYLKGTWNVNIFGNIFEHCQTGYAVYCDGGQDTRITNNKFLYNYRGIYFYQDASIIANNFFFHTSTETPAPSIDLRLMLASNCKVTGNHFKFNSSAAAADEIIKLQDECAYNIIANNTFYGSNKRYYAINDSSAASANSAPNIIANNRFGAFTGTYPVNRNTYSGLTAQVIYGNIGYIAPGEIRTIQYALTAGAAGTYTSKDNPFSQSVAVVNVDIRLTTGDADAPNIDGDINAANNDVSGLSLFNDLPGETAGFYRSTISPGTQTVPQLWASGSGNRYLNIAVTDNDGSQLVGTIIVTVMGI